MESGLRRRHVLLGLSALAGGLSGCAPSPVHGFASWAEARHAVAALAVPGAQWRSNRGWSLSQTLQHLAQSIEGSISGYPHPKSAWFVATVGAAAHAVFDARGRMTHSLDEPIPGAAPLQAELPDGAAVLRLLRAWTPSRRTQARSRRTTPTARSTSRPMRVRTRCTWPITGSASRRRAMPEPRPIVLTAADGRRLAASICEPAQQAPRAVLVIGGAMGVPQSYYAPLARWLAAEHGIAVLCFDYRGMGASHQGPLARETADVLTWARLDYGAALAAAEARWPGLPGGVMAQWRRWCLHPDYLGGESPAVRAELAAVQLPLTVLSMPDDELMTWDGTRTLFGLYRSARIDDRRIAPAEHGLARIGHFGFFREKMPGVRQALWPLVPQWIFQGSTPTARRAA